MHATMPVTLNNGTPSALATPLRVRLLGRFEIVRSTDHTPRALHRKVQAILAYLATQAGQAHGRESLATMFWPERDHTDARNNLRQALHSLRQALGPYAADILWSDR